MLNDLLTNPFGYALVAIYCARKALLLLRELLILRNEWVRRPR